MEGNILPSERGGHGGETLGRGGIEIVCVQMIRVSDKLIIKFNIS
jgi:hypothetical protein